MTMPYLLLCLYNIIHTWPVKTAMSQWWELYIALQEYNVLLYCYIYQYAHTHTHTRTHAHTHTHTHARTHACTHTHTHTHTHTTANPHVLIYTGITNADTHAMRLSHTHYMDLRIPTCTLMDSSCFVIS